MTKSPIKAYTHNVGFIFKAHSGDATKTDLFSVDKLFFSKHTPSDELDAYIKTYFDTLYTQGVITYSIAYDARQRNNYITCEIPNTLLSTFDVTTPNFYQGRQIFFGEELFGKSQEEAFTKPILGTVEVKTIDDYDIEICYNRAILQKESHKPNGIDNIKNTFEIVLDPCKYEDVETSLIKHYQSYLLLGITELTRDDYNMQYTSNVIVKSEATG